PWELNNKKNSSKVGRRKTNELNSIINITQVNNKALKVVEKVAEIDCIDEIIEPGFKNFIKIDKETPRKSQKHTMTDNNNDKDADNNASSDEYNASDNNVAEKFSSGSQYFVTFKRNNHGETIIDHTIENKEDLFTMQEQDDTMDSEYEESTEKTHKRNRKSGKKVDKGKSIEPNKILPLSELPVYEPMKDIKEFHKSYTILLHEMHYEKLKRVNSLKKGRVWTLLTLKELKIWITIVIYMGIHKIYNVVDL
ncbi:2528_t:CDS:2, partial [Gigaspora margarita]